jgi:hypothetical protein
MKRLFICLLILIGFFIASCEQSKERERRDARLSDGQPQVEVAIRQ